MNKPIKLPVDIAHALDIIAQKLEGKDINWVIITSSSLALQGIPVQPDDIDILTDVEGSQKIQQLLQEYRLEKFKEKPSQLFDSIKNEFLISNCRIEVMCNFKVKSLDNEWHAVDELLENPDIISVGDKQLPVLPIIESLKLYKMMAREKDEAKIQKIEQALCGNPAKN